LIPLNLKMHNFMCYRGDLPPFSFRGIHTACICGDNGSGKSTLIDAITWALWGKARAKSDDDLISSGENETEVSFSFSVDKQQYRIIRKRARPKKSSSQGQSSLDLQVKSNGSYKSITGDTIQQTEQKITDILHMDYDTFINSAFLRQGHAAEFTSQRPSKRKEVLANILGLSIYDELEEKAKRYVKKYQMEQSRLAGVSEDIEAGLNQKDDISAELASVKNKLDSLETKAHKQKARIDSLKSKKALLDSLRLHLKQTEEYIISSHKNMERWQSQLHRSQAKIREYQALLKQRATIEEGYKKYSSLKYEIDQFNNKLRDLTSLNQRLRSLETSISEARQQLQKEQAVLENRVSSLTSSAEKLESLKGELKELKAKESEITNLEAKVNQKHKALQEMRNRLASITSRQESLKESLLAASKDSHCPLCEKPLNEEELRNVKSKLQTEINNATTQLDSNEQTISELKVNIEKSNNSLTRLEEQLSSQKDSYKSEFGIITQRIRQAEESSSELKELVNTLNRLEKRLASKDYALNEQAKLAKLTSEIKSLGYDAHRHEKLGLEIKELEVFDNRMKQLKEAEEMLESEQLNINKYSEAIEDIVKNQATYKKQKETLTHQLEELPDIENKLSAALAEQSETDSLLKQAQQEKGSLTERLKRLKELEEKLKKNRQQLSQAAEQESIYNELVKAFGKRGIQAMIIELAIPEIELEANRLLSKMTDGRFNVKMETQRQTKKGDTIETLDIKISDELGTRAYEMYSGGEAFRIDFAVRVALSKLLAKRSGAPLPTLIIDEGFGTQDKAGIERLKEAINSIQDDFEKIFVITHMDELKDAFPTQIQVTKTIQGSIISLN